MEAVHIDATKIILMVSIVSMIIMSGSSDISEATNHVDVSMSSQFAWVKALLGSRHTFALF